MDRSLSHVQDALPPGQTMSSLDFNHPPGRLERMPGLSDAIRHVDWAPNLKAGMAEAQRDGKPLVCVFEEDSCDWCKKFEGELAKPAVSAVGRNAVFVRIHPSQDADGRAMATSLGIDSYPTVSILDFNGTNINERARMVGFMTAEDFALQFDRKSTSTAFV